MVFDLNLSISHIDKTKDKRNLQVRESILRKKKLYKFNKDFF